MPQHVVALIGDGAPHGRVPFEGHGAGEERGADTVLSEDPHQAPDARPAAILKERLVRQVAAVRRYGRHALTHHLALADAVLEQVLRALLVVDDQRDSYAG